MVTETTSNSEQPDTSNPQPAKSPVKKGISKPPAPQKPVGSNTIREGSGVRQTIST